MSTVCVLRLAIKLYKKKTYPVEQQCPPMEKMNIATDVMKKSNLRNIVVISLDF